MTRKEFANLAEHIKKVCSSSTVSSDLRDKDNLAIITNFLILWVALTEDLFPDVNERRMKYWINSVLHTPFISIMTDMKALSAICIADGFLCCHRTFKAYKWASNWKKTFLPILETHQDHGTVDHIYQWARFGLKTRIRDERLESAALETWLDCEEALSVPTSALTEREKELFSAPFQRPMDRTRFRPRHGTGAVAEVGVHTPLEKEMFSRPIIPLYGIDRTRWTYPTVTTDAVLESRLLFVPKTVFTMRPVAMEPAALMWYQQGWGDEIMQNIERMFGSWIHFHDQTYNQWLAWFGSMTGQYATVDLSSASDMVSYEHVSQGLEYAHPTWRTSLLRARSTHCLLPDGRSVLLKKYAPMGSRYSFPLETLFFYSIVRATIEQQTGSATLLPYITIYGDDIVIPTKYYQPVVDRLTAVGMIVNRDKSFSTGPFRESCGYDCYNGLVITPLYYRLTCTHGKFDAQSVIALCNQAYRYGYKRTREYAISLIQYKCAFSDDINDNNAIFSPCAYTQALRLSPSLQKIERLVPQSIRRRGLEVAFDSERALQSWLRYREYTPCDYMPNMHEVSVPNPREKLTWIGEFHA